MSQLSGKIVCRRSFSWPEKRNGDGSVRSAGSMSSFTVAEVASTLEASSVTEVTIPENLLKDANKVLADLQPLDLVECHVKHNGNGRAQLLGF